MIRILLFRINKDWWQFLIYCFSSFAVLWTFLEAVSAYLIPDGYLNIFEKRWIFIMFLILLSVFYGFWSMFPCNQISISLGSRNTEVKIFYDDLFSQNGIIVIPASQYFESEIEEYISTKSLQAQTINKYYFGNSVKYKNALTASLQEQEFVEVERGIGIERKYNVGTASVCEIKGKKIIHIAITETEIKKFETSANSSLQNLVFALKNLWKTIIEESNGEEINIPLIGSGITGIGLPAQRLLELNLIILSESLTNNHNIKLIRILLHKDYNLNEIDLSKIKSNW